MHEFTIQEMQSHTPYNYLAISRAVSELEEKQLLQVFKEWKTKRIYSPVSRKELWNKAMPYLTSPVKKTIYSNEIQDESFYIGGISALSCRRRCVKSVRNTDGRRVLSFCVRP